MIFLLFTLAACKKQEPSAPAVAEPTTVEAPAPSRASGATDTLSTKLPPNPELPRLLDELDPYSCEVDSDCAVTCFVDGNCCGQLCDCTNVYSAAFISSLQSQREAQCDGAICPIASCLAPTHRTVAKCQSGRCTADRL